MTGSQERGIATVSSIAAPSVMSPTACGTWSPMKITPLRTSVRRRRAAITTTFTFPRFLSPRTIQRAMKAPIMTLHTELPIPESVFAAAAALAIITAVQPISWMTFSPAKSLAP